MSDLIDRQMAIDAVEESRRLNHHQDGKAACAHEYEHRHFLKLLIDLPSAQPEQRWIPSGEKPPEEGSYLVWMPFAPPKHRMTVAKYCGGYWNIKTPISAWMPLPEPYQGGKTDEGD